METCPGCDKKIPDDALICPLCKYDLIDDRPAEVLEEVVDKAKAAPKANKATTTSSTGGKGKKQCPKCKQYVGARSAVCACGNDFTTSPPPPKTEKVSATATASAVVARPTGGIGRMLISIPAGKCPVKFSPGQDDLWEWMCQVWHSGHHRNPPVDFAASALRYWMREFFNHDGNCPEYKATIKAIDALLVEHGIPLQKYP